MKNVILRRKIVWQNVQNEKTWKMAGRPDKAGKRMQLEIGLFECPKCKATFREVLSKKKI